MDNALIVAVLGVVSALIGLVSAYFARRKEHVITIARNGGDQPDDSQVAAEVVEEDEKIKRSKPDEAKGIAASSKVSRQRRKSGIESEDVPEYLNSLAEDALVENESLLWVGQPCRELISRRGRYSSPFLGLSWALFLIAFFMVIHRGQSSSTDRAGSLFMAVVMAPATGIFIALIPFYRGWMASRTLYALTTQRCLIVRLSISGYPEVVTYRPSDITHLNFDTDYLVKGCGSVLFCQKAKGKDYGFKDVRNARGVEGMVRIWLASPDGNRSITDKKDTQEVDGKAKRAKR